MTERALFNRRYTSYTPNGTEVWLLNGSSVTTSLSSTKGFVAGVDLVQGQVVFVSGVYAVPAVAASGASLPEYNAVGITSEAAFTNANVNVVLNDSVTLSSTNITAESSLTPGEFYYLSKFKGEVTRFSTASGLVTGASGYGALVALGNAVSTTELQVEIAPPVILYP